MANSHELYNGKAKVVAADGRIPTEKELAKLPERDRDNALFLIFDCETTEETPTRTFKVEVEISHRELSGKALEWNRREDGKMPTQVDVSIKSLVQQGLLTKGATEADILSAIAKDNVGKVVNIKVTEDMKDDGTFWPARARFVSAFRRLTGNALAERLAAFRDGKPAPKASEDPSATMPPAPADTDDIPF